ncbi:hypothetical protein [Xenorhabdus bovienii]
MQRMKIKEGIKFLKEIKSDCPAFLLNEEKMMSNSPLSETELLEFAEYLVRNRRSTVANQYLVSCHERFGLNANGSFMFVHENLIAELDAGVIETLLIHQIENPILEINPIEKHLALWRFYINNEKSEKENNITWMRDFIDSVFIDGFKSLTAKPASAIKH